MLTLRGFSDGVYEMHLLSLAGIIKRTKRTAKMNG
jgi:hypothetical protein